MVEIHKGLLDLYQTADSSDGGSLNLQRQLEKTKQELRDARDKYDGIASSIEQLV